MKIVWDANKASANTEKHGVSFEDAQHVLTDPFALTHEDKHATGEQRFVTLGMSGKNQILVVVYTYRNEVIRLISAWTANKQQQKYYAKQFR